ncbi:hypothetical protein [Prevotella sp. KH2C16]|uniref:hypothetical protein n=1 Tax=Prevotella sp. KH2C16 TaxID=1855325 RepID=UPI0008E5F573|nr:hypothetical protein [Prevotella sp. KH2C16]SFF86937.1 hypothetical protein SAMN05216383_101295 [Prevotella sp. KH2C16]
MEEQDKLTAERSLEIIKESIEQSRRNITKGSWKGMLVWGIMVAVLALVIGHLWAHTSWGPGANLLWSLLGLAIFVNIWCDSRKPKRPDTFVSKTISQVWICFGVMAGSLGLVCGAIAGFGWKLPVLHAPVNESVVWVFPITPIIILFMGLAGMITGSILKSKAITVCCFIAGIFGNFLGLVFAGPTEMVVLAGVCVVGLVVPALIIRNEEK